MQRRSPPHGRRRRQPTDRAARASALASGRSTRYARELRTRGRLGGDPARLPPRPARARRLGDARAGASPGELAYRDLRAYAAALSERRPGEVEHRPQARRRARPSRPPGRDRRGGAATRPTCCRRRSASSRLPRVLGRDEVAALLDRIPARTPLEVRDRALFELAYSCGLRAEEIVSLDLGDARLRLRDRAGRPARARRRGSCRSASRRSARCGATSRRRATRSGRAPRRAGAVRLAPRPPALALRRAPPAREAGSARRRSPAGSPRTRCATRSPPTCSRAARTCARSRSCSGTRASPRPRSTRGSSPSRLRTRVRKVPPAGMSDVATITFRE